VDQLRPAGQVLPDRRTQDVAVVGDLGAEVAEQASAGEPVLLGLGPQQLEVAAQAGQGAALGSARSSSRLRSA